MAMFGYEDKPKQAQQKKQGIIRAIVLGTSFPVDYLKNAEYPTHKEGGIAIRFAVLGSDEGSGGEISACDVVEVRQMVQRTPKYIYDKNIGFGNTIRGGKMHSDMRAVTAKDGRIIIGNILPNTLPVKDFESKKVATYLTPEEKTGEYKKLWEEEKQRLNDWERILESWENVSEDSAKQILLESLSSRLLLYAIVNDKTMFQIPEAGMIFCAKEGNYGDLIGMEWDSGTKSFVYYSNGVEDIDVELAADINRQNSADEEEPPF